MRRLKNDAISILLSISIRMVLRVTCITDDSIRCRPESLKRYVSIRVKWLINGKQRTTLAPFNGGFIDRRSLKTIKSRGIPTNYSTDSTIVL